MSNKEFNPRIYVACLSSYNAGILYGEWIEILDKDAEDLEAEIKDMLAASAAKDAEDWAIHDTDDLNGYTPQSLEEAAAIGDCINKTDNLAVIYWLKNGNGQGLSPDEFKDRLSDDYRGVYTSTEAFTAEYLEELGIQTELEKIKIGSCDAWFYLDMAQVASDFFITDFWSHQTGYEEVYIFSR